MPPYTYAPEFRRRVIHRVRDGRSVQVVATERGVSEASVFRWMAQDRVDRGERAGLSSVERAELALAHRRIRELETELAVVKMAADLFAIEKTRPKGSSR